MTSNRIATLGIVTALSGPIGGCDRVATVGGEFPGSDGIEETREAHPAPMAPAGEAHEGSLAEHAVRPAVDVGLRIARARCEREAHCAGRSDVTTACAAPPSSTAPSCPHGIDPAGLEACLADLRDAPCTGEREDRCDPAWLCRPT